MTIDPQAIIKLAKEQLPTQLDYCSLRWTHLSGEHIQVKKDLLEPIGRRTEQGIMVCVIDGGGIGYAASSDVSAKGMSKLVLNAQRLAKLSAPHSCVDYNKISLPHASGRFHSAVEQPVKSIDLSTRIEVLRQEAAQLKIHDRIVDWGGFLDTHTFDTLLVTNQGGDLFQQIERTFPNLWVTAFANGESQTRTLDGTARALQGGWEHVDRYLLGQAEGLAEDVLQLLTAENCPECVTDLLLMPDQMMLQIHESIGHPLELDRILGDERNYAGTSFVTTDMIGQFQYGSPLLNVTFDPGAALGLASYGFDDDGLPAERQFIIEKGVLKRVLGGSISQARAGVEGVANARAQRWNRPPLDRMANLNIEPGQSSFESMLAQIEQGVLMKANRSWSIDDSRNKFQFGCEWGQLIEKGKLTKPVKNPNYRGISRDFWRSLVAVGDHQEFFGSPWCGKAEPNQIINVGHASPPCLFSKIEVFGG